MTKLYHIVILNCGNGYQKIMLDAGLVVEVQLQFPGLLVHLIPSNFFSCGDM
jgi:hypothetical protein